MKENNLNVKLLLKKISVLLMISKVMLYSILKNRQEVLEHKQKKDIISYGHYSTTCNLILSYSFLKILRHFCCDAPESTTSLDCSFPAP